MYSVFVTPTPVDNVTPTPPTDVEKDCAMSSVVGLRWLPATDNVELQMYRVVRDGSVVAVVPPGQTIYADTSVTQSSSYTYIVVATDGAGNSASSKPLHVKTGSRPATGEPPYCRSSVIRSMKFRFASAYSETTSAEGGDEPPYSDGSDLWPLTVGEDGNTYAFFGDGWGLCGQLDTDPDARRDDKTSFGFARITGSMPLQTDTQCPPQFRGGNIYGGYQSARPYRGGKTLVNGKGGSLLAVGATFYGLGAIWRAGDSGGPGSSPNRWGLVYSNDGGLTWRESDWTFCSEDPRTDPSPAFALDGDRAICPAGFVNFGPGYAGALDEYVYLYAVDSNPVLWGKPGPNKDPNKTYLLRVPRDQLLNPLAYRYFAGTDIVGEPLWSELPQRRRVVFVDPNPPRQLAVARSQAGGAGVQLPMYMSLGEAVYDAPLGRFIATAQGEKVGQVAFYEAAKPWGPWSAVYYSNVDAARLGTGGWGNLGAGTWDGSRLKEADSLGVHIGNAWTSADGKSLWLVFASNGKAPRNARFKQLAGKWLDSFNVVEARLKVHKPR
jgi:hypothetical protein